MKNENAGISIRMGFLSCLTLLFIGLKLTDHIDWSWWWILSPMLVPVAMILLLILISLIGAAVASLI